MVFLAFVLNLVFHLLLLFRNDFVEGTTNRLVTITGAPVAAQTAHTLILHKIREEAREKKLEGGR